MKIYEFLGATSSAPGSPSSVSSASDKLEIDCRLDLYQNYICLRSSCEY